MNNIFKVNITKILQCSYSKQTKAMFRIVLAVWTIALASLALTESDLVVLINSSYPVQGSYSYIELQCLDNSSQTPLPGASFQLNGTDIAENVKETELVFTLKQEDEGFFSCSYSGSVSINTIGLAGKWVWMGILL